MRHAKQTCSQLPWTVPTCSFFLKLFCWRMGGAVRKIATIYRLSQIGFVILKSLFGS